MAKYGPNDDLSLMRNRTATVSVPKGYKAEFSFTKESTWPQSICIYYEENDLELMAKRYANSSSGNLDNWETPYNHSERDKHYIVSGWYNEGGRWNQSNFIKRNQPNDSILIGFNDGFRDGDYNDIVATYKLIEE